MKARIGKDEHVVTAWAESVGGPGWSNFPVLALVRKNGTSEYRIEYIQPQDQTVEMAILFGVSCNVHRQMTASADMLLRAGRRRKK